MDIALVVQQIKQYSPFFNGNIVAATDQDDGAKSILGLPKPACYVIPLTDQAAEDSSTDVSRLQQVVQERIGVVVNLYDPDGQTSATWVQPARDAIFGAILNWNPSPAAAIKGLRYGGSKLMTTGPGWLGWQYEFILNTTITDANGYQPPP